MPAGTGKDQQLLSPGEMLGVLMDEKVSKGKRLVPSIKRTIVQLILLAEPPGVLVNPALKQVAL